MTHSTSYLIFSNLTYISNRPQMLEFVNHISYIEVVGFLISVITFSLSSKWFAEKYWIIAVVGNYCYSKMNPIDSKITDCVSRQIKLFLLVHCTGIFR